MASEDGKIDERISTGMSGLDDILGGGFDPDRLYLVEGTPGAGKTTLALQFLLEDLKRGENALYITLLRKRVGASACGYPALPRAQDHHAHCTLHRAVVGTV
jgi:replicative DNA helicase